MKACRQAIVSSALFGLMLAVAGYLLAGLTGLSALNSGSLFATGLMLGTLAGAGWIGHRSRRAQPRAKAAASEAQTTDGNLFVGNLPFETDEQELRQLFSPYGKVLAVRLMRERRSNRSRGYAFVELSPADAGKATAALNDCDYKGRKLRINPAKRER